MTIEERADMIMMNMFSKYNIDTINEFSLRMTKLYCELGNEIQGKYNDQRATGILNGAIMATAVHFVMDSLAGSKNLKKETARKLFSLAIDTVIKEDI